MRTETVHLDEEGGAGLRAAMAESTRMVGIVGAIGERRIVGVVVESPDPAAEVGPEEIKAAPVKTGRRK